MADQAQRAERDLLTRKCRSGESITKYVEDMQGCFNDMGACMHINVFKGSLFENIQDLVLRGRFKNECKLALREVLDSGPVQLYVQGMEDQREKMLLGLTSIRRAARVPWI